MIIKRKDLEELSDEVLQETEDWINEIQLERVVDLVKGGGSDFLSSKTLVEAWRKWRRR